MAALLAPYTFLRCCHSVSAGDVGRTNEALFGVDAVVKAGTEDDEGGWFDELEFEGLELGGLELGGGVEFAGPGFGVFPLELEPV